MPLKAWKIQILKKWNKMLEIPSFYTCVPKTTIISGTVPEIQSERDRIFCHFAIFCPFTPLMTKKLKIWKNEKTLGDIIILHMCNINDNHMTYDSWDIRHNWVFCRFGLFLPFSLPNNLKNQNFEKNEKTFWRYYHFTFAYYKWGSYHVWFLRYGVQQTELFVILDHFLPFYPLNIPGKIFLKKWKQNLAIYHFTLVYHKWQS